MLTQAKAPKAPNTKSDFCRTKGYNAVFGLKVKWQAGILDAKAVVTVKAGANPTTTRTSIP